MPQTAPGALVGIALGAYGKKPVIPKLGEIDPSKIQQETLAGNEGIMGQAFDQAGRINTLNVNNLKKLFEQALPGQFNLAQENTSSMLKGQVPQDVQDAIQRTIAARNLGSTGSPLGGSGFGANNFARHLGLSSLQLQQQGFQQFSYLQSMFPRYDPVQSMFFTPQQRLSFAFEDRAAHFARNLMDAQVQAAPNPADAALAEGLDNDFAAFRQMLLSYAGGAMGGGGGGGGSSFTSQQQQQQPFYFQQQPQYQPQYQPQPQYQQPSPQYQGPPPSSTPYGDPIGPPYQGPTTYG